MVKNRINPVENNKKRSKVGISDWRDSHWALLFNDHSAYLFALIALKL